MTATEKLAVEKRGKGLLALGRTKLQATRILMREFPIERIQALDALGHVAEVGLWSTANVQFNPFTDAC